MKIVEITWVDSIGVTSEWELKKEIEPLKPVVINSIGYLMDDNKDFKTIVQSDSKKQVVGRMTIPTECIKKIVEIKRLK